VCGDPDVSDDTYPIPVYVGTDGTEAVLIRHSEAGDAYVHPDNLAHYLARGWERVDVEEPAPTKKPARPAKPKE
jgi:hypothetical protein